MARAAPSSFDLVFLDPPFDSALAAPALAAAARVVAPDGWIYLEQPRPLDAEAPLPAACASSARGVPARCTSTCCGGRRGRPMAAGPVVPAPAL